jgi:hypothetical protein
VSNRLCGLSLEAAVAEMGLLAKEAEALPGASRKPSDNDRHLFTVTAQTEMTDKGKAASVALGVSIEVAQSALQEYIAAYLKYRNSLPLSVMHIGGATGDGEATLLKVVQYWEATWTDKKKPTKSQVEDLIVALGALFSPDVIDDLSSADTANLPGKKPAETTPNLRKALRQQHCASLATAFPNLTARLDLSTMTLGAEWDGTVPDDAKNIVTGSEFGIQLVIDAAGKITNVVASGRPKHGAVGGLEGDHTTAYVVSVRTIEQAVRDQDLKTAAANLKGIEVAFRDMPGAKLDRTAKMSDERSEHLLAADTATVEHAKAAAKAPTLSTVQAYAGALLYYRNSIALTVVAAETVSTGKGEAKRMNALQNLDARLAQKTHIAASELVHAVAGLFDPTAIEKVLNVTGHNRELIDQYSIEEVYAKTGKSKKAKLMPVDDLPDDMNVEALATQDVLHEYDSDEQTKNSRRDLVPGYAPGESIEALFGAVFEQHLRSIALVAPFAFGGIDEEIAEALVISLIGDSAADAGAVVTAIKGLLTHTTTKLVKNDLAKQSNAKHKQAKQKQKQPPHKQVDWSKREDEDYYA